MAERAGSPTFHRRLGRSQRSTQPRSGQSKTASELTKEERELNRSAKVEKAIKNIGNNSRRQNDAINIVIGKWANFQLKELYPGRNVEWKFPYTALTHLRVQLSKETGWPRLPGIIQGAEIPRPKMI